MILTKYDLKQDIIVHNINT